MCYTSYHTIIIIDWLIDWLIEWCFTPLSIVCHSYHGDSLHYSFLSWVSQYKAWALKCLAWGHFRENPKRSNVVRTHDPWIKSQTLYQWDTQDPLYNQDKSTACGCQRSAVVFLIEDKKSKSKRGIILKKDAFWIVSLDSMDCSLDSEHILRLPSRYLR